MAKIVPIKGLNVRKIKKNIVKWFEINIKWTIIIT